MIRYAHTEGGEGTPPFFTLFVNSICNLTCEHCFYWQKLNRPDDLTFDEIKALSDDLGPIENLNLSGGEPFIRTDLAEVVRLFIRSNGVREVYVPTNGYYTARTEKALTAILEEPSLRLFAFELSLDGMAEYHNRFRGNPASFQKAMETYDLLARMQNADPRVRIHASLTATHENIEELRNLTDFLHDRCPAMDHINLSIIRGDRLNQSLRGPALDEYRSLYEHIRSRWADREQGRYGAIVEPLLQWAKTAALEQQRQPVPCRAGVLSGVVYANGDVSVCEQHPPLGNLRQRTFRQIWSSAEAVELRRKIAQRECWCTAEICLWPSLAFQPLHLVRSMVGARVWRRPAALPDKTGATSLPTAAR